MTDTILEGTGGTATARESLIYDVVVIGAGVSGLYTAYLLRKKDPLLRLLVLETSSRLGGRILTKTGFAPWPIDLGGEFVHGEKTLHKQFCDEHGLKLIRTFCSFPPHPYFKDRPTAEYVWLPQQGRLITWTNLYETDNDFKHLIKELILLPETAAGKDCDMLTHLVSRGVAQHMITLADSIYAKTWSSDLSWLRAGQCAAEDGKDKDNGLDNYILENGSMEMLHVMAQGLEVRLNSGVSSVRRGEGVSIVQLQSGAQIHSKRVVMATPITAFQAGAEDGIAITPAIGPLSEGAKEVNCGACVKVILSFTQRFWPDSCLFIFCADSLVSQLWMDPPRSGAPSNYFTVTGFITGMPAQACALWPAWRVVDAFKKQLDLMFSTKTRRTPASDCFDDHIICNWVTFPGIRLSYTSPGWADCSPFSDMHHEASLAFVGEHVAAPKWEIATINGAMESARAVVERWYPTTKSKL